MFWKPCSKKTSISQIYVGKDFFHSNTYYLTNLILVEYILRNPELFLGTFYLAPGEDIPKSKFKKAMVQRKYLPGDCV